MEKHFYRFFSLGRIEERISKTNLECGTKKHIIPLINHVIAIFLNPEARKKFEETLFIWKVSQFEPFLN